MTTANLTKAHQELFRRGPDEVFTSLPALHEQCLADKQKSFDLWQPPGEVILTSDMTLCAGENATELALNDWSFSQLCKMAGVAKDTINRLSHKTASRALQETLPGVGKPLQILARDEKIRSIHGVTYTRLWNADMLSMVREYAVDFQPPQEAAGGGTGLYCGEQDMFCFLIDPTGWAEIDGQAFAPGFFVWNSEVGRRSVGIQAFWFQAVCQNHIVWDATEIVEFSRKHTANVHDSLGEIRRIIETLVAKREQRRDGFVEVLKKAMVAKLGADAEEVGKNLFKHGIPRGLANRALEIAKEQGRFTIFSLVDALTRETQHIVYAGDRTELDQKVAALLSLALAA